MACRKRIDGQLTGRLNYPMLLVTTAADGDRSGCLVGMILERHKLGDHVAFVLDPVHARDDGRGDTLTFSDVKRLEPGRDA